MPCIIKTKIKRANKMIIKGFKNVPTTIISDCMNRMNCMHAGMKSLISDVKMVGSAITVQCISGSNLMSHKAIYLAQAGDVIVVDARGDVNTAVWGYVQTFACMQRKISGVVIDGSVRDSQEVRKHRYPLFCKGISPAGPHKGWPDNINVTISCAGVSVSPGDIIVGDDDGIVVVPLESASKVLKLCYHRMATEEKWLREIKKGKTSLVVIGLDKKIKDLGVENSG
ncbi:RraA family protein [Candidatus Omnitrophota bacterium]